MSYALASAVLLGSPIAQAVALVVLQSAEVPSGGPITRSCTNTARDTPPLPSRRTCPRFLSAWNLAVALAISLRLVRSRAVPRGGATNARSCTNRSRRQSGSAGLQF